MANLVAGHVTLTNCASSIYNSFATHQNHAIIDMAVFATHVSKLKGDREISTKT